jgi:hypothetical protein
MPYAARREIQNGERAQAAARDANYWRNAYEELVRQTGRDLNDGLGVDPRKSQAPALPEREAVARVLAPEAFSEWQRHIDHVLSGGGTMTYAERFAMWCEVGVPEHRRTSWAYERADKILNLFALPPSRGGER